MIGHHVPILDILLFEHCRGLLEQSLVDPGRDGPMFFGDQLVVTLGFCLGGGAAFEFCGERHIVEECPRVVEFGVPGPFEVPHRLDHTVDFFVTN